jgi:hypothetical protein
MKIKTRLASKYSDGRNAFPNIPAEVHPSRSINAHLLPVLPAIMVVCLCLGACGGTSHDGQQAPTSSRAVPPSPSLTGDYDGDDDAAEKLRRSDGDNDDARPKDQDNDSDSSGKSYFDGDDDSVRHFGHAASAAEKKAIVSLVKRYFAAAGSEEGATACSMIISTFAKSVPETLGGAAGPPYARGPTCAVVMSGIFAHYRRQIAAHAATLEVPGVRVAGKEGMAVLAFRGLPGRSIRVAREHSAWRIDSLLDMELP